MLPPVIEALRAQRKQTMGKSEARNAKSETNSKHECQNVSNGRVGRHLSTLAPHALPKSARAVLEILVKLLNINIGYEKLEERAADIEKLAAHLSDVERMDRPVDDSDLQYIG